MKHKHTKIVCTVGPASEKVTTLRRMVRAGMNVARLNFSHGSYAHHRRLIRNIRQVAKELDEPIALLQDLQGPKLRIGDQGLPVEGLALRKGEQVWLVPDAAV